MKQTVTVNATPGDATKEAKVIAERFRAQGKTVTIGSEYEQTVGHKAGLLSVDLAIEDATPSPMIERVFHDIGTADALASRGAIEVVTTTAAPAVTAVADDSDIPEHLRHDAVPDDDEEIDRLGMTLPRSTIPKTHWRKRAKA